jgi:hypothetical protein
MSACHTQAADYKIRSDILNTRLMWCKNLKDLKVAHHQNNKFSRMFAKKVKKERKLPVKQDGPTTLCENPGIFMFGGVNESDFSQNDLYFIEFN